MGYEIGSGDVAHSEQTDRREAPHCLLCVKTSDSNAVTPCDTCLRETTFIRVSRLPNSALPLEQSVNPASDLPHLSHTQHSTQRMHRNHSTNKTQSFRAEPSKFFIQTPTRSPLHKRSTTPQGPDDDLRINQPRRHPLFLVPPIIWVMKRDGSLDFVFVFHPSEFRRSLKPKPKYTFHYSKAELSPEAEFCLTFLDHVERAMKELFRDQIKERGRIFFREPQNDEYRNTVKHPMDIERLRHRVTDRYYETRGDFKKDLDLIWQNTQLYFRPQDQAYQDAVTLREMVNELWTMHNALEREENPKLGSEIRRSIERARELCRRDLERGNSTMTTFRMPKSNFERVERSLKVERPRERVHKEKQEVRVKETPMEPRESLELAKGIDVLPLYHLGRIIQILERATKQNIFGAEETIRIPFSQLGHKTLRKIQDDVQQRLKDQQRSFAEPPDKLKAMLEEDLEKIKTSLKEKEQPDITSENETGTEGASSDGSDGSDDD